VDYTAVSELKRLLIARIAAKPRRATLLRVCAKYGRGKYGCPLLVVAW
jgi:hypothetical protein